MSFHFNKIKKAPKHKNKNIGYSVMEFIGIFEQGGAVPTRHTFFGLEINLMLLHTPYASIVRVENKIHIVNIDC